MTNGTILNLRAGSPRYALIFRHIPNRYRL